MQAQGVKLLDQAFEQVTDEQIDAFNIKTGKQRMDSTFVASNIRKMGRLQLLVDVIQRVHRMLSGSDQEKYVEAFMPYLKGHHVQYVYRVKGKDTCKHIHQIGIIMQRLLVELKEAYAEEAVYHVLERVFGEHYYLEEQAVQIKTGDQLSASSLQSPDDLEARVREVKHPFPVGKLSVRSEFRVTCLFIGSAATTNVRPIKRCLAAKEEQENESKETKRRADIT